MLSTDQDILHTASECEHLPVKFRLGVRGSSAEFVEWNTVIRDQKLYVFVPMPFIPEGSKEGFVALLEYVEKVLKLTHVIICLDKNRVDRGVLVKTFMFFGFTPLAPMHPMIPKHPEFTESKIFLLFECSL